MSVKLDLSIDEVHNGYIIHAKHVGGNSNGHYIADNKEKVKEIVLKLLDVYFESEE